MALRKKFLLPVWHSTCQQATGSSNFYYIAECYALYTCFFYLVLPPIAQVRYFQNHSTNEQLEIQKNLKTALGQTKCYVSSSLFLFYLEPIQLSLAMPFTVGSCPQWYRPVSPLPSFDFTTEYFSQLLLTSAFHSPLFFKFLRVTANHTEGLLDKYF